MAGNPRAKAAVAVKATAVEVAVEAKNSHTRVNPHRGLICDSCVGKMPLHT